MKASVALTTYNGMGNIKELLDSIKNQKVLPDEVIIVDDCSTDNTYEYVLDYIKNNKLNNWKAYRNESNIGWRANFRKAFQYCTGDLVFPCDQDDIWMNYKIKEMKSVMEANPGIKLLLSNYIELNNDRKDRVKVKGLSKNDLSLNKCKFKANSLIEMRPGCTTCVHKDLINEMLENDRIEIAHDTMLWGYATIDSSIFLYNRITMQYRRHVDSASAPQKQLGISRRLNELKFEYKVCKFFKNICQQRKNNKRANILNSQLKFYKKRIELIRERRFFAMVIFAINNYYHYATIRNMLSDFYIIILNKK